MAVPTIVSVSPTSGAPKGRNVLEIVGTNFRLPDPPPASGYIGGAFPLSIEVEVDGIVSPAAQSATAELIYATAPQWRGDYEALPADLDVTVRNVNADGTPIIGEEVTLVDGYTVKLPELPDKCYLQRTIEELVLLFKRNILKNVAITTRRDYVRNLANIDRLQTEAPVLYLIGPETPQNRFYSINREDAEEDPTIPDGYLRRAIPVTEDISFEIQAWAKTSREIFSLGQAIVLLFRDVTTLRVERDPDQPLLGYVEYEIGMPFINHPSYNMVPSRDDLSNLTARCVIKGVHLDDEAGTILERGWEITSNDGEPTVETEYIDP